MDNDVYGRVRALFVAVLVVSVATLAVAAAVGAETAVWVRGGIVTVIAAVLIVLAARAHRGSRGAYRRLRLMTAIAPVAILAIVAIPQDGFPLWMKIEQALVGVLVVLAAVMLNRRAVRRAYALATDHGDGDVARVGTRTGASVR